MKIAILSDVHGNLEALTAVLEDLEGRSVDRICFLGDAVGYGADPESCIETLARSAFRSVAGNHDLAAAADRQALGRFHEDAAASIRWTRDALTSKAKERLRQLPMEWRGEGVHLVHGSPCRPDRWEYVLSAKDAERGFGASESRVIFVGHSHVPAAYVEVERKRLFTGVMRRIEAADPAFLRLDPRYRYLLNVGSVGQPRDGDPRAAYAIFEPEAGGYTLLRVAYDVERAAGKIRRAGLPEALAQRLETGN